MQESSYEYKVDMVDTTHNSTVYCVHSANFTCISSAVGNFDRDYWLIAFLGFMPNLHRNNDKKLDQTSM